MKVNNDQVKGDPPAIEEDNIPVGLHADWSAECLYDMNMVTNPPKYHYL